MRLRPAPHSRTPIESYSLKIKPQEHFINWQQDPFGNYLARLVFPEKMSFEVDLVADMVTINPFDFFVEEYAETLSLRIHRRLCARNSRPTWRSTEDGPRLQQLLAGCRPSRQEINDFLVDLNQRLQQDIDYLVRMEPGIQTWEETLEKAIGSCRDTGWLLVQILRHLGLAARFVSGYLVQLKPDEKSLDGPSGAAEDFTDLHAWCEVYLPGAGWVGLDPTSGLFAGEGHIPLACTPNPVSAAPITGATDKCEVEFSFHNTCSASSKTRGSPSPTARTQWQHILALGARSTTTWRAGRCAPDHGRRADLRLHR